MSDKTNNIVTGTGGDEQSSKAAEMIRQKVESVYKDAPDTEQELFELKDKKLKDKKLKESKHQQFMSKLSQSGMDLASIQTEWHKYYSSLPEKEKHQVWQEFYERQDLLNKQNIARAKSDNSIVIAEHKQQAAKPARKKTTSAKIKNDIRHTVTSNNKVTLKHHFQSLLFGLAMGCIVIFIFLFGFFNEVFIAPFIQPSRTSTSTPIILDANSPAPTTTPEVIVPKINVQIPVDYTETSTNENVIENDLEDGVVHYPTTVLPGQTGNAAFFGHSSNNIFNPGKYKFAFVLLHTIVPGDTFYLTYENKVFVYKVISRNIVSPNDVSVLNSVPGQTATATLITCDPPGTSINRLIVVGQQISPNPNTDVAPSTVVEASASSSPTVLPGNGNTLWERFIDTVSGKIIVVLVAGAVLLYGSLRIFKRFN